MIFTPAVFVMTSFNSRRGVEWPQVAYELAQAQTLEVIPLSEGTSFATSPPLYFLAQFHLPEHRNAHSRTNPFSLDL